MTTTTSEGSRLAEPTTRRGARALLRSTRTLVGALLTGVLVAGSLTATPVASHAAPVDGVVLDDAAVRQQSPTTNYGTSAALIVRNDIESFLRLDLSAISTGDLASVDLKLNKKYSANQIVVTQASEFLTSSGAETDVRWDESTLTWANRPLDLPGTRSLTTNVGAGEIGFSITITSLVTEAKARGAETLSLRLSTSGTVGTDIHSTRALDPAQRPVVDVVYGVVEHMIKDDAWVRTTTPTTNYGTGQNLVVGKGGHTYLRLDVSQVGVADLKSVVLNLTKYNNAATVTAVRAGEFLTQNGAETTTRWGETTVTWNTRPLDLEGSPVIRTPVPQGLVAVPLDVTEMVRAAKAAGSDTLTVHLTTEAVDDLNVAGTDIYSSRAANLANVPWVAISYLTDEIPQDYPVAQRFDDYASNARAAQDVVRIANEGGRYLDVDDSTGAVGLTGDVEKATMFAIYGHDYTASEYDGTGGGQRTSYAIKSLSNGKFLTIQNYSTAEDGGYYTQSGHTYFVTATAPEVKWNERFQIQVYPQSNRYTISSHLTSLRDGSEASTTPVKAGDTATTATPGDRSTHRYVFESVDADLLEVQQSVTGTSAHLGWVPVQGDTDPGHYSVEGGATVVHEDGVMRTVVEGLAAGEHTFTVGYSGGANAIETEVTIRVFNHPGVSLTQEQLTAMRDRVAQKAEPWYSDYLALKNTVPGSLSSLDFEVEARAGVGRGNPEGSGGMDSYEKSSAAAYFHALQWVITEDVRHADKVVEILNAWSSTLTQIDGRDQILGAGLGTVKLINAAEIVRYYDGGYVGYADEDFTAFQQTMLNVVYPVVQDAGVPMIANGNWDLAAIVAVEAIGVVTDNATVFDEAVSMYTSPHINGSIVNYVSDWGQATESARDQAHAQLGLGLMGDISTIADNQGLDLWALEGNKLARAYNWVAEYNLFHGEGTLRAEPIPNVFGRTDANAYWDEMDQQIIVRGQMRPIYENALAHYSDVEGVDVSWMSRAAAAMRPQGFVHFDHLNFETLTMYDGEPTEQVTPYFQLRTMLKPWYQRTWSEVSQWGEAPRSRRALVEGGVVPADFTTETLDSYFAVQDDRTVALDAMQQDAPFFRLVTNDDESYSVQDVASGRYLGVTTTVVDGENVIEAGSLVVGDAEKFELRSTGLGRYNLVHDGRLVKVAVEGSLTTPQDAAVTLRLGTTLEADGDTKAAEVGFFFSYGEGDVVDKSEVTARDSRLTTADTWDPLDNLEGAIDHRGAAVDDLSLVGVTGEVDVTTPGTYTVTYHSGTATATATVTVVQARTVKGFYAPIDMGGVINSVKAGSTIPLKFEVFAGEREITDTAEVQVSAQAVACSTSAITDEVEVTTTGGTALRYDATDGQFVYTLRTPNTVGTCYAVTATPVDGTSITAYVKTR